MKRREFLKTNTLFLGSLPFMQTPLRNNLFMPHNKDYDVYECKIGAFTCRIFKDYMFKYLASDFFMNAKEPELTTLLMKYRITADNIPSPFIAILLENANQKILIDTGIGYSDKPITVGGNSVLLKGRLIEILEKENIKKEDITDIVVTHFHPDHIGGVFDDNDHLNFPNARFIMHEDEWNYWHSPQSDNQPGMFKQFIKENITGLKNFNLELIKGDFTDVLPGIAAVKIEGHTPGQIALMIRSNDKNLLYASDVFLHPIHMEKLDWQTSYDLDHEKAKQSRIKILELAYKENILVNAFHFDFPGLGRIDRTGNDWKWNYAQQ
jgi:glyoxylase-like metal-dependent hydrolase (beta-lactamase superfamily II)